MVETRAVEGLLLTAPLPSFLIPSPSSVAAAAPVVSIAPLPSSSPPVPVPEPAPEEEDEAAEFVLEVGTTRRTRLSSFTATASHISGLSRE